VVNSLGSVPLNWLACRYLLVTKQLQVVRLVLSYKPVNCCTIANSVGTVPLNSLWDSDLLTLVIIRKHKTTYF